MEALEKGSVYTAVIDGYSSEGLGIARVNGAVVFVPHAVRGEDFHCPAFKITIRDFAFFNKAKKSINFSFVHVSILWPVLSTYIVGDAT